MSTTGEILELLLRDRVALSRRQAEADRVIAASGAGHLVHEMNVRGDEAGSRPWRIDPIPVLLDGAMFDQLAAAITQRMQAFERILSDLYGPRQLIRDGVVAGEALSSTSRYRVATVGAPAPSRWLTTYAADVVALADGTWRLVADFTDAPTGVGYALLDRSAMLRVADEILGAGSTLELASLNGFPAELRHALITTTTVSSPRIVLYTGGVDHPGYVEHSSLARLLGFTMVERPDLVVRQGRLWLRTLGSARHGGLDPIDVVYRRVEGDRVDPIELGTPGVDGVPGLLAAVAEGGVVLANAHGSGLIEEPVLAGCWSTAAEALTGRALPLPLLGDAATTIGLAESPVFRGGEVTSASVVVRLHAVAGPNGVAVMPGGNGRVLAPADDPRDPRAHRAKDVWVIGAHAALPLIVAAQLPQVDLAASVPTRAADALFWMGRSAERAEAIARTIRAIASRRRQDPGLVVAGGATWTHRMVGALRAIRSDHDVVDVPGSATAFALLDAELAATTAVLISRLREFVGEAATVGEFLASNTARSLNAIVGVLDTFGAGVAPIDAIDDVLASLAAFMGMWNESTVRGPAWRFGDIGVRLERALVVFDLCAACLDPDPTSLEVLLASNESLIAYRRRYRSDVEPAAALTLLVADPDNPRGYRACLDRLAEHADEIDWPEGRERIDGLIAEVDDNAPERWQGIDPVVERLLTTRAVVAELADMLVAAWFATPVRPTLVMAGRR